MSNILLIWFAAHTLTNSTIYNQGGEKSDVYTILTHRKQSDPVVASDAIRLYEKEGRTKEWGVTKLA